MRLIIVKNLINNINIPLGNSISRDYVHEEVQAD